MIDILRNVKIAQKKSKLKSTFSFSTTKFSLVFVSFILFLLVIWAYIIYPIAVFPYRLHNFYMIPKAHHAYPQTTKNPFIICITKNRIYLDSYGEVENTSNLPVLIRDGLEELVGDLELNNKEIKIHMRIYGDAKWETVLHVLKGLKKLNIHSVALITQGLADLPEYIYHEARKKKNLLRKI